MKKHYITLSAIALLVCLVFTSCTTTAPSPSTPVGSNPPTALPEASTESEGEAAVKADGVKMIVSAQSGKALTSVGGIHGLAHTPELWGAYIKEVTAWGDAVTFDCNIDVNTGLITSEVITAFKKARNIANG